MKQAMPYIYGTLHKIRVSMDGRPVVQYRVNKLKPWIKPSVMMNQVTG